MAVLQDEKQNTEIVRPDSRLKQRDTFRTPEELYAELEETVKKYHPSADDLSLIHRAYVVAYNAHREQKRKSGEPYIIHPLCVSLILADLELDKETIVAALLHDVLEDTVMCKGEMEYKLETHRKLQVLSD